MTPWEYHRESSNLIQVERLNELGGQGWELVGIDSYEIGFSFLYFKRPHLTTNQKDEARRQRENEP